jgi:hypothetical protein
MNLNLMKLRKFGCAIAALMITGALVVLGLKLQAAARLREQNRALSQQLEQLRRLEAENQRLYRLVAQLRADTRDRLIEELARLRLEVERLRPQKAEWEALSAENHQLCSELGDGVRPLLSKDAWTYVGYGDPESALQSTMWAWSCGDPTMLVASLSPTDRAAWGNLSDEEVATRLSGRWRLSTGFQILGQKQVADDEVALMVNMYPDRPDIANAELHFKRIGSEWKRDCDLCPIKPSKGAGREN